MAIAEAEVRTAGVATDDGCWTCGGHDEIETCCECGESICVHHAAVEERRHEVRYWCEPCWEDRPTPVDPRDIAADEAYERMVEA